MNDHFDLTFRREQVLRFIHQFRVQNGYAPVLREIAEHFGLTASSTIHCHLKHLEEAGYVKREHKKPRSLRLTQKGTTRLVEWPGEPQGRIPPHEKIRQLERRLAAYMGMLHQLPYETIEAHCPEAHLFLEPDPGCPKTTRAHQRWSR